MLQINLEFIRSLVGKVFILISGLKTDGMFTTYKNKMQIYEVLEYSQDRDNKYYIKTNLVEWECHDVYCTMKRTSDVILSEEEIKKFFEEKNFIQLIVTKDKYRFKEKKEQNLENLKRGDIVPIYSKYGDYQDEYLVSEEDIDKDIKNKQLFYITSISNVIEAETEDSLNLKEKTDLENAYYDINSFGFEIGESIDTYPINRNKHYQLGNKSIEFFKNMVETTSDGNWMIIEKFNQDNSLGK